MHRIEAALIDIRTQAADQLPVCRRVGQYLRSRRIREKMMPAGLFSDPAWDMLLDLFVAGREARQVSVSSVCLVAPNAGSTMLRHLAKLVKADLVVRSNDPDDGRRSFVRLTEAADAMIADWADIWLPS